MAFVLRRVSMAQPHRRMPVRCIQRRHFATASDSADTITVGRYAYPRRVRITEVAARDGIQSHAAFIPTAKKVEFINRLSGVGFAGIEATGFLNPKMNAQLADATSVMRGIRVNPAVAYSVLTPNERSFHAAAEAGCKEVSIFSAASESFSLKNSNVSIAESLIRIAKVAQLAHAANIRVRGYVSCVLGCPYEGTVLPSKVTPVVARLMDMGCYEVALADTIGAGAPGTTAALFEDVTTKVAPGSKLAVHFHDTYGQALSNILIALQYGCASIDSSLDGLGGCPYSPGSTGNVATEDVVYGLHSLGIDTGVDVTKMLEVGEWMRAEIIPPGTGTGSRVRKAWRAKRARELNAPAATKPNPSATTAAAKQ